MIPSEEFAKKLPVVTGLSSAEIEKLPAEIRDRALFSARVEESRIIYAIRDNLTKLIRNEKDPSEVRRDLRKVLDEIGYSPDEKDVGTIKDLRTKARLDLIMKTNVDQARGYRQYRQFTTPAALEEFPASRLVRVESRRVPRDWRGRFLEAARSVSFAGVLDASGMVGLKTSPVWIALSRFGHPYPPFDFNSGMGVENVSIDECRRRGWEIPSAESQSKEASKSSFNDDVSAYVPFDASSPEYLELLRRFAGRLSLEGGVLKLMED